MTAAADAEALDQLADLFRLPEWQVRGSGADFIEWAADTLSRVRDLDGRSSPDLLEEAGYTTDDYEDDV